MRQAKKALNNVYSYERSWNYVLWLLARKAYTQKQLKDKLLQKQAEPEVVERVLARLSELKLIDDKAYAESYVRSQQRKKGSLALKQALQQRGIEASLLKASLEPLAEKSQIENAKGLLEKNLWRISKAEPQKRYAKAYGLLARRGFPGEVVKKVLEAMTQSLKEA